MLEWREELSVVLCAATSAAATSRHRAGENQCKDPQLGLLSTAGAGVQHWKLTQLTVV